MIQRYKAQVSENALIEWVVWQLPNPVKPSEHRYKYRLVYIVDGVRVVGFDNEKGKGGHRHIGDTESPYSFVSIAQLRADFIVEVEKWNAR